MDRNKDIVAKLFKKVGEKDYTCNLCEIRAGISAKHQCPSGYSNLMNHLNTNIHKKDWENFYKSLANETSTSSVSYSKYKEIPPSADAEKYFGWIEIIVNNNYPFTVVEDATMRKYVSLPHVCIKSTKLYMWRLYEYVKDKLKDELSNRFGIIFDGWSNGTSEHLVAVYASGATKNGAFVALLGINELNEHGNQNANNHIAFINGLLSEYGRDSSCLDFVVADNAAVNLKTARNLNPGSGIPFIGCYSHKFNLAVSQYQDGMHNILNKVEDVVKLMRTNNAFGLLKDYCEAAGIKLKRPQLRNVTRWSSTYVMLKSYMELHPHLFDEAFESIDVIDKLLTPDEYGQLREYLPKLEELNDVSKALQSEALTLHEARTIFDVVLAKFGGLCASCPFRKYLSNYNTSVFENAVIKVGRKEPLNVAETTSLRNFEINDEENSRPTPTAPEEEMQDLSVMDQVERVLKRQRTDAVATNQNIKYGPMYHISPTSNVCERLFSQTKIVYSDRRKSMKLETFEMLLFLKSNKRFWTVRSLDEIIAKKANDIELFFDNITTEEYEDSALLVMEEDSF